MNAIQKYLIAMALDAANEAAGKLVASNRLDPVMVALSLKEFVQAIKSLDESVISSVPCTLEYKGYQAVRPQTLSNAAIEPVFVQPPDKI